MSTEVIPYRAETLGDRMEYARTLASAGDLIPTGLWAPVQRDDGTMAPPQPSPGKVLLVLETGAMLGIHPVAALGGIHIIDNKATISPALMSAVVRGAGHTLRVRTEGSVATGDLVGIATLIRKDDPEHPFEARFDLQDALSAELIDRLEQDEEGNTRIIALSTAGKPLAWQKTPRNLVKRRAISEVCRDGAEDVLMGVHYTPEELGAEVDDLGEFVAPPMPEAAPTPPPAEPSALPPTRKRAARGTQGVKRKPTEEPAAEGVVEGAEPEAKPDADVVDAEVVPDDAPTEPEAAVAVNDGVTVTATDAETAAVVSETPPPDAAEEAEAHERSVREREAAEATARAEAEASAPEPPAEEFALQEPPMDEPDWGNLPMEKRVELARTPAELKLRVWDVVQGTPQLTKELQDLVLARKLVLENAEEAARAAAATGEPVKPAAKGKPSTRAAVLDD